VIGQKLAWHYATSLKYKIFWPFDRGCPVLSAWFRLDVWSLLGTFEAILGGEREKIDPPKLGGQTNRVDVSAWASCHCAVDSLSLLWQFNKADHHGTFGKLY
jgi:hypothetical protein